MAEEDVDDVVGLDEDVKLLLQRAIFNEFGHRCLNIRGLVGIGKTVLARQIYDHAAVVREFEARAWVCLSDNAFISNREVRVKIIQQVAVVVDRENQLQRDSSFEKVARANIQSLRLMLNQHLQGKRFLIVVDDIPEDADLDSIVGSLQLEATDSRLLITSRSHCPEYVDTYNYDMKFLDSEKSWQLFLKTILCGNKFTIDDEHKFPKKLERKERVMLTRCGGLPLAIKDVGRQIAKGRQLGIEWEQLLESVDFGPTLEVLEVLFYHKLDQELKSCFLHLAFFKENSKVRLVKLIHIWLAREAVSIETLQLCLERLVRQSIIGLAIDNKNAFKELKSCRINTILHMLSIKKAEDEIGFEILSKDGKPSQIDPRHRVIICSRDNFNYSTNQNNKHLVSLLFRGGGYLDASPSYWESFELLEILDFDDFGLKILPESIGTLMELRYLGLRNNYVQQLPHSFGCLEKLEVVDMEQNFMMEVPDLIWKMGNLRHLYMSDVIFPKPLKIEALENLEVLTYISVDNWPYEFLGLRMMTRLYKLGIEEVDGNSDVSKLFASLAELKKLSHLVLRGFRFRSMPCLDELGLLDGLKVIKLDGLLPRLPSADHFPPYLNYLYLVNSCLDEDPMPVLENLPKLEYLKLRNAYIGQQVVMLHYGFPSLRVLCMEELCKSEKFTSWRRCNALSRDIRNQELSESGDSPRRDWVDDLSV